MIDRDKQLVLIVSRPAEGGIRTHIVNLLEHLDRSRFEISLAAPSKLIESLPRSLPPFVAHPLPITAKPGVADPFLAIRIAQLARSRGAIVHAQGVRAGIAAALAKRSADFPLAVTYHNVPEQSRLANISLDFVAKQCDAAITVSRAIAAAIENPSALVIPNGIALDQFPAMDSLDAKMDFGIGPDQVLVACVARLSKEKGVDVLLRAAALLPSDVKVLVAGSGSERARLESAAPANVRFLGYVRDPARLLSAADIAVIPSRTEGQGIVALEAMACGAALVASDVGGLGEAIQHGVTGLLTPPEDAVALAAAVGLLIDDAGLRQRLAEAGRRWVRENCDVRRRVREIEKVYDRLGR